MGMGSDDFKLASKLTGVASSLWGVLLYAWIYSIGNAANARLSNGLKRNPIVFRVGLIFAACYMLYFGIFIFGSSGSQPPTWVLPLHFLAMTGSFYGLWYAAKQFGTLRHGEITGFMDYSGVFFMLWFFPIGVWFIQPIVNERLARENET